jgi:RNA polymerase subunit RPABC4/transcription elongation factor Spt4
VPEASRLVVAALPGKQTGMPATLTPTEAGPCLGCGELVPADAAFCPTCGTRQVADRPMPVTVDPEETRQLERSTNAWLLAAAAALALLLLGAGMAVGGLLASTDVDDAGGGSTDGATAAAMDSYAPIGAEWTDKHVHLAEEAGSDDTNGLAAAATDARLWIDVNRVDLAALPAMVDGDAAVLFDELVAVYDERSTVLADIEATATDGGGEASTADELAALDGLDVQADAAVCGLADIMRSEGDEPHDHITPAMDVAC